MVNFKRFTSDCALLPTAPSVEPNILSALNQPNGNAKMLAKDIEGAVARMER